MCCARAALMVPFSVCGLSFTNTTIPMINRTLPLLLSLIGACVAQDSRAGITFLGKDASCGNPTGELRVAYITGLTPPYTYAWSNGSTNDTISDLYPGWYTVTVTDVFLSTLTDSAQVIDWTELQVPSIWNFFVDGVGDLEGCPGQCNGQMALHLNHINGLPPYNITFNQGAVYQFSGPDEIEVFGPFCNGEVVDYTVVDQYGCTGSSWGITIWGPTGTNAQIGQIVGACAGGSNGSVLFNNVSDPGMGVGNTWVTVVDALNNVVAGPLPGGGSTVFVDSLPAGNYTAEIFSILNCNEYFPFVIPDLGPNCGTLSGHVHLDHDQDCIQDANDENVALHVLEILPGPIYTITDAQGAFTMDLPSGNYTIARPSDLIALCPAADPYPFTISNGNTTTFTFADSSNVPLDMAENAGAGIARPGFQFSNYMHLRNTGGQVSGPVDVTFTFDAVLSFVSATPAPTSVAGNVVTWNGLTPFGAFASQNFGVLLEVPPNPWLIGTDVVGSWVSSQPIPEVTLLNNTVSELTTITGSFDPNDKTVRTSTQQSDQFYYINQDEFVDYVIRFQNTGTDTAFTVAITDTLDADLDMSSFEQGVSSHPFAVQFLPERVVKWTFNNILLPDSNTNEAMSHGLVSFRIKPAQPLLASTVMTNNADIFFDFNPPIRTNDAVVVATQGTDVGAEVTTGLMVYPNPAMDELTITITDADLGSLAIFSADGRVVRELTGRGGHVVIGLGSLEPGLYAVRAGVLNGRILNTTFIKR